MEFADPNFFFGNLLIIAIPLSLLLSRVRSDVASETVLATFGMYLAFLVAPRFLFFWLVYWLIVWCLQLVFDRFSDDRSRGQFLFLSLGLVLLPMVTWKIYGDFLVQGMNQFLQDALLWALPPFGEADKLAEFAVPLGLSFSTFRSIDLLIKRYLGLQDRVSLRRLLFYGFFPPVLLAGPIIQIDEVSKRWVTEDEAGFSAVFMAGIGRVLVGLIKIYVLALPLQPNVQTIVGFEDHGQGTLLLAMIGYSWYLYLNFAGFSDLSIGCARMFGYRLNENFSLPYFRPNLQAFWAHWHMSLTGFAQRYVFVPLGGYRRNRQFFAIVATMMTIALWHDVNIPLVVFGVAHSTALITLRVVFKERREEEQGIASELGGIVATYSFVCATLPLLILSSDDLIPFYRAIIGL